MADQQDPKRPNQLNIEISEEVADGIYSNLAIITHSNSEFVLDFVRVMPGVPKAKVRSRILLTPQHAKRLMRALADNLRKFESVHGEIREADMPDVIMLDATLPDMDTVDFIRQAMTIESKVKPQVVISLTQFDIGTIMRAKRAGAKGYILKPFNRQLLIDRFRSMDLLEPAEAS